MRALFKRRAAGDEPTGPVWGNNEGWKPLPTMGPAPLQIGVFAGQLLNQYPAYYTQPQLHQGVEGLRSNWFVPTRGVVPDFMATAYPQNVPGGQRMGSTYTGPLGPISSRRMQSRVVAAQVRQSGLQAMQWAQGLSG